MATEGTHLNNCALLCKALSTYLVLWVTVYKLTTENPYLFHWNLEKHDLLKVPNSAHTKWITLNVPLGAHFLLKHCYEWHAFADSTTSEMLL